MKLFKLIAPVAVALAASTGTVLAVPALNVPEPDSMALVGLAVVGALAAIKKVSK